MPLVPSFDDLLRKIDGRIDKFLEPPYDKYLQPAEGHLEVGLLRQDLLASIGDDIDEYNAGAFVDIELEAEPRADGWDLRCRFHKNWAPRHLEKKDGWTQALINQLERIINELPGEGQ
jgi:hypothetical protein